MNEAHGIIGANRRGWSILTLCALAFVISTFYRLTVTVLSPWLITDLGLTTAELGNLSAVFFYAFAASQIPLGPALDRFGPRWVMTILSLVTIAGAVMFALADQSWQAFLARIILGVGTSGALMGTLAILATWFPPERFATMSGLVWAAGTLGQLLAATPLVMLAENLGWRRSLLVIIAGHMLLTVIFFMVVRDRPPGQAPPPVKHLNPLKQLKQLYVRSTFWVVSLGIFFRFGFFQAMQGLWAGPFLIYGLGLEPMEAGHTLLFMVFGYMISLPLAGRVSDRVVHSRKYVIIPGFLAVASIVLVMSFWKRGLPVEYTYVLFFLFGVVNGPGQVMFAHFKELVPGHLVGTAMTGLNLVAFTGSAVMMQAAGFLLPGKPSMIHNPEGFAPLWWFMASGLFIAGLVYTRLPDSPGLKRKP